jgi:hypothetical protein
MTYDAAYLARSFVRKFHRRVYVHLNRFAPDSDRFYLTLTSKDGFSIEHLDTVADVLAHINAVRT